MAPPVRRVVSRGEVYRVNLDPTRGSEIHRTRPCLVISPDDMNHRLRTVIVAPMTTGGRPYPTRIPCTFRRMPGFVVLDQVRTVDTERLGQRMGVIAPGTLTLVLSVVCEMFAE